MGGRIASLKRKKHLARTEGNHYKLYPLHARTHAISPLFLQLIQRSDDFKSKIGFSVEKERKEERKQEPTHRERRQRQLS